MLSQNGDSDSDSDDENAWYTIRSIQPTIRYLLQTTMDAPGWREESERF